MLLAVDGWFRTGTESADGPGALWEPIHAARASGGLPARVRGDVRALAGHVAAAAARAVRTAPELLRPVPERLRPARRAARI